MTRTIIIIATVIIGALIIFIGSAWLVDATVIIATKTMTMTTKQKKAAVVLLFLYFWCCEWCYGLCGSALSVFCVVVVVFVIIVTCMQKKI